MQFPVFWNSDLVNHKIEYLKIVISESAAYRVHMKFDGMLSKSQKEYC